MKGGAKRSTLVKRYTLSAPYNSIKKQQCPENLLKMKLIIIISSTMGDKLESFLLEKTY